MGKAEKMINVIIFSCMYFKKTRNYNQTPNSNILNTF